MYSTIVLVFIFKLDKVYCLRCQHSLPKLFLNTMLIFCILKIQTAVGVSGTAEKQFIMISQLNSWNFTMLNGNIMVLSFSVTVLY